MFPKTGRRGAGTAATVDRMRARLLGFGAVAVALLVAATAGLVSGGAAKSPRAVAAAVAPPRPPTTLTKLPHAVVGDGTAPLVVRLSGPVAPGSPLPALSPSVAGKWTTSGTLETFAPASTLAPCASYRLTIWARTTAAGHAPLGARRVVGFSVACPSTLAAEQALARLRYLPYAFHTNAGVAGGAEDRATAARHAFRPQVGWFVRDVKDAPPLGDATTRGALMAFQADRRLSPTGDLDAPTWAALIAAETAGRVAAEPYTFVTVSQQLPQTLAVHRGNRVVLTTPANAGVPGSPTADGVFPIFERLTSTTMKGTNPDGTQYDDPGVPWVNYFNGGDAVHGFDRASYGSPQSDGCVELPPATAAVVYRMLGVGDIVEVSG